MEEDKTIHTSQPEESKLDTDTALMDEIVAEENRSQNEVTQNIEEMQAEKEEQSKVDVELDADQATEEQKEANNEHIDEERSANSNKKQSKKEKKKKKEEIIQNLSHIIFGDSSDDEDFGNLDDIGGFNSDTPESKPKKSAKGTKRQAETKKRLSKEKVESRRGKRSRTVDDPEVSEVKEQLYQEPEKELSDFDQMLARLKSRRSRKKTQKSEMEVETMVANFINKMYVAAEEDITANKDKQPALSKLKMLPEVANQLRKKKLQQVFTENNLLAALQLWLKPLPDGSLPNLKVRQTLLEILHEFKDIPTEDLKESGIGRAIMVLWKHSEETPHNKKLAKNLIEKWSRPIFGISSEYKDLGEAEEMPVKKKKDSIRKEFNKSTVDLEIELDNKSKIGKNLPESPSFHARIPEKVAFDFKIRPKAPQLDESNRDRGAKYKKIENKLLKLKSTPNKSRASPMSIEGRNLLI